jgi:hypothetical protein
VCTSRRSEGVVLSASAIARVVILWVFCNCRRAAAEPEFLVWPAFLFGGVYHTSNPYVILGRATEMYSLRISFPLVPVDGLVSLLYCSNHLVVFATALWVCSFDLSCESISIPRYFKTWTSPIVCPLIVSGGLSSGILLLSFSGSTCVLLEACRMSDFVISNLELCVRLHSSPPSCFVIRFLSQAVVSSKLFPIARRVMSST